MTQSSSLPIFKRIPGMIHITGEHDVGKTTFALEAALPDRTIFLDADIKGRGTVTQLENEGVHFGAYHSLVTLEKSCSGNEVDFHEKVLAILDAITPGQFDCLIWDTWRRFEKTLAAMVFKHPGRFRQRWSAMGSIKGAEMNAEADEYGARLLNDLQQKIPLVVIVTHLKDAYIGDIKTGKKTPEHGRSINRVCRMRLWLRRNPASPVPVALVLKRLDVKHVTELGLRTVSILPPKITPQATDLSLWDAVLRYLDSPVGNRPLMPSETPNAYELSILEDTLTPDQMIVLRAATMAGEKAEEVSQELLDQAGVRARELLAEGFNAPQIVNRMLEEVESGSLMVDAERITIPAVAQWITKGG